jgi:arginyl-tRNA synthetase
MNVLVSVRCAITSALASLERGGQIGGEALEGISWTVERPKRAEHGNLATNAAMAIAKRAGKPPRMVAEALVGALSGGDVVRSATVAGPGFVNLWLSPRALQAQVLEILKAQAGWGRAPSATGERINIEFVSANPTGPITVASGRNAVLGDTLARLLEATGHRVTREYYINDRGNQVRLFAESVRAAARGEAPPEDGYKGAYVSELAAWLQKIDPDALEGDGDAFGRACIAWMLRGIPGSRTLPGIRPSLAALLVDFDVWFSEESLLRWGAVPAAIHKLDEAGYLLKKDGAIFFKAPDGALEDKDRVVQKSDGSWAYFASDIAYFADKIGRGYDRLINVLGADHHGYVTRVHNALTALGLPHDRFEALLYQLVFVVKQGEVVKSSKRAGNVVTIDEVMDEIDDATGRRGAGADALRFFFLMRSANSNIEFDVDLAKRKSLDNPVFYVQYGYARLSSIQRKARSLGLADAGAGAGAGGPVSLSLERDLAKLEHPDELAICQRMAEFPEVVIDAARQREPHRLVFYVQELARDFQSYFTRLKSDEDTILPSESVRAVSGWEASWDFGKMRARLAWVEAIRITYGQALNLLGIAALERMERPPEDAPDGAESPT